MRLFATLLAVLSLLSVAPGCAKDVDETGEAPVVVTFHLAAGQHASQATLEAIAAALPDFGACVDMKGDPKWGMLPTVKAEEREKVEARIAEAEERGLIPDDQMLLLNAVGADKAGEVSVLYCLSREPGLMVRNAKFATVTPNQFDEGHWQIQFELDEATSKALGELTAAHINERLAIVHDGKVLSAPVIRDRITTSAVISGDFSKEEAEKVVAALNENTKAEE